MSSIATPEQQQQYIKETLVGQMEWHDRKAAINQRWFKRLRIIVLVISATIPFLSGLIGDQGMEFVPFLIGVSGIVVTVSEGLIILNKYQENWVDYRKIAEALRREKTYYDAAAGLYATSEDPFQTLVGEVGSILGQEVNSWAERIKVQNQGNTNV